MHVEHFVRMVLFEFFPLIPLRFLKEGSLLLRADGNAVKDVVALAEGLFHRSLGQRPRKEET